MNRDNKNKTEILRNNFREIENAYNEANKILNKTNYMNEVTKVNIQEADDNLEVRILTFLQFNSSSIMNLEGLNILFLLNFLGHQDPEK